MADGADPLEHLEPREPIGFAAALYGINGDVGGPIIEAIIGYRAALASQGFSDGAVELMVVDYHRQLVSILLRPAPEAVQGG